MQMSCKLAAWLGAWFSERVNLVRRKVTVQCSLIFPLFCWTNCVTAPVKIQAVVASQLSSGARKKAFQQKVASLLG